MNSPTLTRRSEWEWRVEIHDAMRVPVVLFRDPGLARSPDPRLLRQLVRVASLPGVVDAVYAMPNAILGSGFPAGVVAAFDPRDDGVVCCQGVGFDAGCGVRILTGSTTVDEVRSRRELLAEALFDAIPDGLSGPLHLTSDQLEDMMGGGAQWAVELGYGRSDDLDRIEDAGRIAGANPAQVSAAARNRQRGQLGTLGSGCHYLEIQYVAELYETEGAAAMGLREGQCIVSIHSGSRGIGHQVCIEFERRMTTARNPSPDDPLPNLANAPIRSQLGQEYLGAMRAATNCAYANRQVLTHIAREVLWDVLGADLSVLCGVAHNTCRAETHRVGEKTTGLLVHRRSATSAEPPGGVKEAAKPSSIPLPVIGSLGRPSYVVTPPDSPPAFNSACHGTARIMGRAEARARWDGAAICSDLADRGVLVRCGSHRIAAEEAPGAYGEIERVITVGEGAGLLRRVARLDPLIVIRR